MKMPASLNSSIRLLVMSAVHTLPWASTSSAPSRSNCPSANPEPPVISCRLRLEVHCSILFQPESATQIEPSGPIAIELGSFIGPAMVLFPLTTLRKFPVGPNFWIRLLPVSAIQRLPLEVAAMPWGAFKEPLPLAAVPAWQTLPEAAVQRFFSASLPADSTLVLFTSLPKRRTNSPFSLNSSIRLLAVSATQRLPVGSIAKPAGALSLPPAVPEAPTFLTHSPFSLNCEMRLLPLSRAQTLPFESRATSAGWFIWPLPLPKVPKPSTQETAPGSGPPEARGAVRSAAIVNLSSFVVTCPRASFARTLKVC